MFIIIAVLFAYNSSAESNKSNNGKYCMLENYMGVLYSIRTVMLPQFIIMQQSCITISSYLEWVSCFKN